MKMKTKVLILTSLVVAVAAASWLYMPEEAAGRPPYSRLIDYYADATFTELVGSCYLPCEGVIDCEEGTVKTTYQVTEYDYCDTGYCCIRCYPAPCPQHIIDSYPCPPCS